MPKVKILHLEQQIELHELRQILVAIAPDVFAFFNKDPQDTIVTEEIGWHYEAENSSTKTTLKNEEIVIQIYYANWYHDNSMSGLWMTQIEQSIQLPRGLFTIKETSTEDRSIDRINYELDSENQDFVTYYSNRLREACR
jgi:hypothetical protein